ncbi:hypothetical protein BC834DRAFT_491806 [Gloeopeniophorella convolvens]|nr:hypothetical protein BC834DRAFT_491806 [Gloeopeniophorella convolvens]
MHYMRVCRPAPLSLLCLNFRLRTPHGRLQRRCGLDGQWFLEHRAALCRHGTKQLGAHVPRRLRRGWGAARPSLSAIGDAMTHCNSVVQSPRSRGSKWAIHECTARLTDGSFSSFWSRRVHSSARDSCLSGLPPSRSSSDSPTTQWTPPQPELLSCIGGIVCARSPRPGRDRSSPGRDRPSSCCCLCQLSVSGKSDGSFDWVEGQWV